MAATAREALRRELPTGRLQVLADAQGIAAEAGFYLAAGQRRRNAVIAVEHSRAIWLSRVAGELDPQVRARLLAAGRSELLDSYLDALDRRSEAYRRQYLGDLGPVPSVTRGGRSYRVGVPSSLEAAQAQVTRLAREVRAVTGGMDLLELPSYELAQKAASRAPVVYLAATDAGGYALVVRHQGEPVFVPLPALRPETLELHVRSFTAKPPLPAAVRACVDWLASGVLTDFLQAISGEPEIALIPLGKLSLLPVHAALIQATAHDAGGPVTVRYLPNARAAASLSGWPEAGSFRDVLVVEAAGAPGAPALDLARAEAEALAHRYDARWLPGATSPAVLRWLGSADMVQFMCHGRADLADPLASGLLLMDGWLTVRALLSRAPLRRQLVILGACESQVAGISVPDEVIGLPASLYQAGAAGVVAAQWQVDERAALLLLRRFHDLLSAGSYPAQAVSAAQDWLRTTTRGEMSSRYPELFAASPSPQNSELAAQRAACVPYEDPVHWAAFSYTGI